MEKRAEALRRDTENLATNIKTTAEDKAAIIKTEISSMAKQNALLIDNVLEKIKDVDTKVMRMLNDLSTRADLTNGAVKSIRLEIAQTNEDVNSLFDLIEQRDGDDKNEDYATSRTRRRKRLQELRRRKKRQSIEEDSLSEHSKKQQY